MRILFLLVLSDLLDMYGVLYTKKLMHSSRELHAVADWITRGRRRS